MELENCRIWEVHTSQTEGKCGEIISGRYFLDKWLDTDKCLAGLVYF
jgi:hypothetical protein